VNDENHAVPAVSLPGTSLVATLRNVFIPTPDPSLAPRHPADPIGPSPVSSTTSLDSSGKCQPRNPLHGKKGKEGKLTDYINTLEISNPEHGNSKEAVVVLHGYAAALG
jgi:cardiolipin-specific phospholipase